MDEYSHMKNLIDTDVLSEKVRAKSMRKSGEQVLIARLNQTLEAKDSYTRINCDGYGRIRTFKNYAIHLRNSQIPRSAVKPLLRGHPTTESLRTQVFQIASCNWRCWYCYVDDQLLSATPKFGSFMTSDQLLDLYIEEEDPSDVIDLSGGQPDLVPEWNYWIMQSMIRKNLVDRVYLWIDDNLSTRFLWKYLTVKQIDFMLNFPKYSRAGCFKGCDRESFVFNTHAMPSKFDEQFSIFKDLLGLGFDMYAYATLTLSLKVDPSKAIKEFVDRLQNIHTNLPLRTIPLRIIPFTATRKRIAHLDPGIVKEILGLQDEAYRIWDLELQSRFVQEDLELPYEMVKFR